MDNESALRVHLHLGAHKTATTHLQGLLWNCADQLSAAGVTVNTPRNLGRWFKLFQGIQKDRWWRRQRLTRQLRARSPKQGLWLLSHENFSSVPGDLMRQRALLPALDANLRTLQRVFPGALDTVFLSIRSYERFFLSNYLEVMRRRGYFPFERFYDERVFEKKSWVDVIERLQQVLAGQRLVLWRYEDYRALEPEIVRLMTGLEDVQFILDAYKPSITRPSLSAKAVEVLRNSTVKAGSEELRQLQVSLGKEFPLGDEYPAFNPWSGAQIEQMRARYEQDVREIKSRFPSIRFLQPG